MIVICFWCGQRREPTCPCEGLVNPRPLRRQKQEFKKAFTDLVDMFEDCGPYSNTLVIPGGPITAEDIIKASEDIIKNFGKATTSELNYLGLRSPPPPPKKA